MKLNLSYLKFNYSIIKFKIAKLKGKFNIQIKSNNSTKY